MGLRFLQERLLRSECKALWQDHVEGKPSQPTLCQRIKLGCLSSFDMVIYGFTYVLIRLIQLPTKMADACNLPLRITRYDDWSTSLPLNETADKAATSYNMVFGELNSKSGLDIIHSYRVKDLIDSHAFYSDTIGNEVLLKDLSSNAANDIQQKSLIDLIAGTLISFASENRSEDEIEQLVQISIEKASINSNHLFSALIKAAVNDNKIESGVQILLRSLAAKASPETKKSLAKEHLADWITLIYRNGSSKPYLILNLLGEDALKEAIIKAEPDKDREKCFFCWAGCYAPKLVIHYLTLPDVLQKAGDMPISLIWNNLQDTSKNDLLQTLSVKAPEAVKMLLTDEDLWVRNTQFVNMAISIVPDLVKEALLKQECPLKRVLFYNNHIELWKLIKGDSELLKALSEKDDLPKNGSFDPEMLKSIFTGDDQTFALMFPLLAKNIHLLVDPNNTSSRETLRLVRYLAKHQSERYKQFVQATTGIKEGSKLDYIGLHALTQADGGILLKALKDNGQFEKCYPDLSKIESDGNLWKRYYDLDRESFKKNVMKSPGYLIETVLSKDPNGTILKWLADVDPRLFIQLLGQSKSDRVLHKLSELEITKSLKVRYDDLLTAEELMAFSKKLCYPITLNFPKASKDDLGKLQTLFETFNGKEEKEYNNINIKFSHPLFTFCGRSNRTLQKDKNEVMNDYHRYLDVSFDQVAEWKKRDFIPFLGKCKLTRASEMLPLLQKAVIPTYIDDAEFVKMSEEQQKEFKKAQGWDNTIIAGSQTFHVHKSILGSSRQFVEKFSKIDWSKHPEDLKIILDWFYDKTMTLEERRKLVCLCIQMNLNYLLEEIVEKEEHKFSLLFTDEVLDLMIQENKLGFGVPMIRAIQSNDRFCNDSFLKISPTVRSKLYKVIKKVWVSEPNLIAPLSPFGLLSALIEDSNDQNAIDLILSIKDYRQTYIYEFLSNQEQFCDGYSLFDEVIQGLQNLSKQGCEYIVRHMKSQYSNEWRNIRLDVEQYFK